MTLWTTRQVPCIARLRTCHYVADMILTRPSSPRPDQVRYESDSDQVPPQPSYLGCSCNYSCFCGEWYPKRAHSIAFGVDSRITVLEPDVLHLLRCPQGWLRPESPCPGRRTAQVRQHADAPNRPDVCTPHLTPGA